MPFRSKSLRVPTHQVNPDLMDYLTRHWMHGFFLFVYSLLLKEITFNKRLISFGKSLALLIFPPRKSGDWCVDSCLWNAKYDKTFKLSSENITGEKFFLLSPMKRWNFLNLGYIYIYICYFQCLMCCSCAYFSLKGLSVAYKSDMWHAMIIVYLHYYSHHTCQWCGSYGAS